MSTGTYKANGAVREFVSKLKRQMDYLGVTPTELARKAKVGRPYLYRVLSGTQTPSLDWADKVGKQVGLRVRTMSTKKAG